VAPPPILTTEGFTKNAALVPLAENGSSTVPSQSLSMPSQTSSHPPGNVAQSAFTALQLTALGPLQTYFPVVRHAPSEPGDASSLAQPLL
jgi:hypothetical protein